MLYNSLSAALHFEQELKEDERELASFSNGERQLPLAATLVNVRWFLPMLCEIAVCTSSELNFVRPTATFSSLTGRG